MFDEIPMRPLSLTVKRSRDSDIITELPEPLIHRIFSFLSTIDAVRTSLLSRAWRDRWKSSPFLSFRRPDFGNAQNFCLFIDTVLLIREPVSLHTFRLTLKWHETDLSLFNAWIHHAVRHKVRELFLELFLDLYSKDRRVMLPSCIFSCKTLEKFSLKTAYEEANLQPPVSVALDGLRILRFDSIDLLPIDFNKILAGCPVLEELYLQYCTLAKPTFSSQRLKLLEIVDCDIYDSTTIVSNPRLEKLVFCNNCNTNIQGKLIVLLEKLPSLVFCTIYYESDFCWKEVWFKGDGLSKNLNHLEMSLPDMEGYVEAPISFLAYRCTLYNLKHLKLHIYMNNRTIKVVNQFLTSMPNLETLVITEIKDPAYKESEESISEYIKLPVHLHSVDVIPLTPLQVGMSLQNCCFHIKGKIKKLS